MIGYAHDTRLNPQTGRIPRWRLSMVAALIFLPLWSIAANDGMPLLPDRPTGRVEDMNRNPTLPVNRRIYMTYGGNILFRFPNYTDRIGNFHDGSIPNEGVGGVVFQSDSGMSWDGRGLILTPNYSSWLLIKDRYARQIVGDPQLAWPWLEPPEPRPEETGAPPLEFPPLVGYRSLEPTEIEGFVGPHHGPVPQPTLVQKSYVEPLKPKLGVDGNLHYVPSGATIEP